MPICCQHGLPPQKSQVTDSTAVRFVTTGASGDAFPTWTLAQSFVLAALPKPYQMRGLKTPFSITPSSRMPKQRFGEQVLLGTTVVDAKFDSLILFLPFFFLSRLSLKKQPNVSVRPVAAHGIVPEITPSCWMPFGTKFVLPVESTTGRNAINGPPAFRTIR